MNDFSVDMNEYLPLRDVVFNTLRKAILKEASESHPQHPLWEIFYKRQKIGNSKA